MTTAYITHPICLEHEMGVGHPECPARLLAIEQQLQKENLFSKLQSYEAPLATIEQISLAHSLEYIEQLKQFAPAQNYFFIDADTSMNAATWQAALHAAGAVILATDLVLQNKVDNAFCAVRPPGHHAEYDRAMGFCFFNNIAVGVTHAFANYYMQRIAIIDFDVHHGNGTENIFRDDPRVLFCSSFQAPFYPYSGEDTLSDHIVNMPLRAGASSQEFRDVMLQRCFPALEQFKPELIYISAGFDAHTEDVMAQINLVDEDYQWITEKIIAIANRHAEGKIISSLEGGYALKALGRCVAQHVQLLVENSK